MERFQDHCSKNERKSRLLSESKSKSREIITGEQTISSQKLSSSCPSFDPIRIARVACWVSGRVQATRSSCTTSQMLSMVAAITLSTTFLIGLLLFLLNLLRVTSWNVCSDQVVRSHGQKNGDHQESKEVEFGYHCDPERG